MVYITLARREFSVFPTKAYAQYEKITQSKTEREVDIWDGYAILRRICAVESTGDRHAEPRQFNSDGSPLWGNDPRTGKSIKRDVGACQENSWVWKAKAQSMKLDIINSLADNVTFAKWLFDREGSKPWNSSKNGSNGWGQPD